MTEDEFWTLVEQLDGAVTPKSAERLTKALVKRPEVDITGFADQLAWALYRLDTPAHAERDLVDPASGETLGMSSDSFLYVRAGTVAAGRAVYEQAVADPAALLATLDAMDGEHLLEIAPEAWDRKTGMAWDHETPVSYETGSNWQAWGTREPEPYVAPWLSVGPSHGEGADPGDAQPLALFRLADAIGAHPAWQAWWEPAGVPELELNLYYGFPKDEVRPPRVRKAKRRAQADVYFGVERTVAPTPEALRALVAEDYLLVFGLVRDKFSLPPLPPLPVAAT